MLPLAAEPIAVQHLTLRCDDGRVMDAVFYWNPDQLRLTIGKKKMLLPAKKKSSPPVYKNEAQRITVKRDVVLFSENGKETSCRIKRR